MTRDEFCNLPPMIALGIVWDLARPKLEPMKRPEVPRPPLFDGRLSRGNKGFSWMSEMTLSDLEWWEGKKRESSAQGGQYAGSDLKAADTLAKWIAWRRLFQDERWNGKRGEERVTAKAPARDADVHPWPPKNEQKSTPSKREPSPENDGREEPEYDF